MASSSTGGGMATPLLGSLGKRAAASCLASAAHDSAVVLLFVSHVALGACERASFRLMAVSMSPFYVLLHQLVAAAHLLVFAPVACAQAQLDVSGSQLRRCPKHALLTMAIFDTLQCLLALYAGRRVLGVTQVVLVQGTIPCTMLLAALVLGTRFERAQVYGAALVLASVLAGCTRPSAGDEVGEDVADRVLFALSCAFAAMSAVYKRRRLMLQVVDCVYLNAWLAFFQFACGLALGPLLFALDAVRGGGAQGALGSAAPAEQVFAHSEVLRSIDEGVRCIFWAAPYPDAECTHALSRTATWLLSSCLLAATSGAIMQLHSVPALYAAEVLVLPAAVAALSSGALMGLAHAAAEAVSANAALQLLLAVSGLCIHHSGYVLRACSRHLRYSPSFDGEDSYNTSQSHSSSRSDRGDTGGELSGSPPGRLALPPHCEIRDAAERPLRAVHELAEQPKLVALQV